MCFPEFINMRSRAQEQFLSSLRLTLFDLARRLQQDTVSEDVADYVLFRLEQISRHLVRLADNMQMFDTVRTSLVTVTRMLSEVERNWHYSSPAVAYQPRTVVRPIGSRFHGNSCNILSIMKSS